MSEWTLLCDYERDVAHAVWVSDSNYDNGRVMPGWYRPGDLPLVETAYGEDTVGRGAIRDSGAFVMWRKVADRPEPPEPPKPLIQRVCEWLAIPTRMFGAEREEEAILWRIQEELLKRHPAVLEEEGGEVPEEWAMTYRIHYGLSGTFCGHTRGEALLKVAAWLKEMEG